MKQGMINDMKDFTNKKATRSQSSRRNLQPLHIELDDKKSSLERILGEN